MKPLMCRKTFLWMRSAARIATLTRYTGAAVIFKKLTSQSVVSCQKKARKRAVYQSGGKEQLCSLNKRRVLVYLQKRIMILQTAPVVQ